MKIINSIKFVLLLLGVGNLNLSFAQADLQDQHAQFNRSNSKNILENEKIWENKQIKKAGKTKKEKVERKKQQGKPDTILDAKWMTVDFSEEIQSAYPCQAVGLLIQTQHITIGEEVDAVVKWEDDDDKSQSG